MRSVQPGPVTTWFRKAFTLSGNPASTYTGTLIHAVDDGAVFYVNGTEVARANLTGPPTATTNADSDVTHPMFSSALSIPPGLLHAGGNVLAVELHQAATGGADALFGADPPTVGEAIMRAKQGVTVEGPGDVEATLVAPPGDRRVVERPRRVRVRDCARRTLRRMRIPPPA